MCVVIILCRVPVFSLIFCVLCPCVCRFEGIVERVLVQGNEDLLPFLLRSTLQHTLHAHRKRSIAQARTQATQGELTCEGQKSQSCLVMKCIGKRLMSCVMHACLLRAYSGRKGL
jgi:hypothetical protein